MHLYEVFHSSLAERRAMKRHHDVCIRSTAKSVVFMQPSLDSELSVPLTILTQNILTLSNILRLNGH
jgi:hypothetical protein